MVSPSRRSLLKTGSASISASIVGIDLTSASNPGDSLQNPSAVVDQYKGNPGNTGEVPTDAPQSAVDTQWETEPELKNHIATQWPVVDTDEIICGIETFGNSTGAVIGVDAATGKQNWRLTTESSVKSPTVTDEGTYIGSKSLHALTPSHEPAWTFTPQKPPTSAPTYAAGTIYVTDYSSVHAIKATDGSKKWQAKRGIGSVTPPAVSQGIVVTTGNTDTRPRQGIVQAFDSETGTKLWERKTAAGIGTAPVMKNDQVVVSDSGGTVYAITPESGELEWKRSPGQEVEVSPSITNSRVFVGDNAGDVYGISRNTGRVKWSVSTGHPIQAPLSVFNESVVVPTINGIDVLSPGGQTKWSVAGAESIGYHSVTGRDGSLFTSSSGSTSKLKIKSLN